MTYAKRVDNEQKQIVADLRRAGFSVAILSRAGFGIPDLLIGGFDRITGRRVNRLAEIKSPGEDFTDPEIAFILAWRGEDVLYAESAESIMSTFEGTAPDLARDRIRAQIERKQRAGIPRKGKGISQHGE